MKSHQFSLILATAFLDLLGMSLFIPIFPSMIHAFGVMGSWTGYSQAVYAIGMFIGGLFFGRLSDTYGRKRLLSYTSILNLLGYIIMLISVWNLDIIQTSMTLTPGETMHVITGLKDIFTGLTPVFLLFLLSRFIAGLGGAGYGVIQAYISDISRPEDKTKRMGMMGAVFGVAFLVGPLIGGLLAKFTSVHTVILTCSFIIFLNVLLIWFVLQEPKKHVHEEHIDFFHEFHFSRTIIILLVLSFGSTLGFSAIQALSGQYYVDKFGFRSEQIGYTMAIVGVIAILYQGGLVRYVRKYFDEKQMIFLGFSLLTFGFIGFSFTESAIWIFFWIIFFPLGMGSFNPSVMSLIANRAGKEVGKVMGYNTSIQSIGQIFGPIIAAMLYSVSIRFPFFASAGVFFLLLIVAIIGLRE